LFFKPDRGPPSTPPTRPRLNLCGGGRSGPPPAARAPQPLADVTRILSDLRQTWQEALEKANEAKPVERVG
jgi:hypothetical protein